MQSKYGARGRGVEPRFTDSKSVVLPLDDPRLKAKTVSGLAVVSITPLGSRPEMGSLIKKRRKRMRKKKHRKMLKATRFQRRAAGK